MDYKRAKIILKKIKTLLNSFESLDEPLSEIECEILLKYADKFKSLVPHVIDELIETERQAKVTPIVKISEPKKKTAPKKEKVEPIIVEETAPIKQLVPIKEELKEEIDVAPAIAAKTENLIKPEAILVEEVKEMIPPPPVKKASPKKTTSRKKKPLVATEDHEAIAKISLWEKVEIKELSHKLSFSPIKNIMKSISINERIFTQTELFNGDNALFVDTLDQIEKMTSFEDVVRFLRGGVAKNWEDSKKIKKAEQFMKLVQRRFL